MSYDGHRGVTVSSIRPRVGRPLRQRRFRTALDKHGCAASTNSARLPQTTAASRKLGSVRLGYREGRIMVLAALGWLRSAPELRPSGVGTTRRHLGAARAPRFYETNRIGFITKTGGNTLKWSWIRSKRVRISIRFVFHENGMVREAEKGAVHPP